MTDMGKFYAYLIDLSSVTLQCVFGLLSIVISKLHTDLVKTLIKCFKLFIVSFSTCLHTSLTFSLFTTVLEGEMLYYITPYLRFHERKDRR